MSRDLVLALALGILGGVLGSAGTLAWLTEGMNWNAVGAIGSVGAAIGTVAAVVAALMPVYKSAEIQQRQAMQLRLQLGAHLRIVRAKFSLRTATGATSPLDELERRTLALLESLGAQLHVLSDRESTTIQAIIYLATMWPRAGEEVSPEIAADFVTHAGDALQALYTHGLPMPDFLPKEDHLGPSRL